ncbi:MAG: response regulator [Leptolyngbyaceae cyanobacterium SM2_3_12]|nr:response regulator [Leptolyngbyaceae cyanobacterium SM2_3_12]
MSTLLTGSILIVDDEPTNLEVICAALSAEGLDTTLATSGEQALRQIERELPDLIVLDTQMPGLSGLETCQRLKANPQTWDIPVILMAALSDPDEQSRRV